MKAVSVLVALCLVGIVATFHNDCQNDSNCPPCPFPHESPHCHSDGHCYCGTPIECNGPDDVTTCGTGCTCQQEHDNHFHCICPE